jgi:hypothetical protein
MSKNSKLISSRTAQQAQARSLRDDGAPVQVLGFESDDGETRPIPGNDFPQFEVPKQVDGPQLYRRATFVSTATEQNPTNPLTEISFAGGGVVGVGGDVLTSIDVRDARFITFFFRYFPGTSVVANAVSVLAVIPEVTLPIPQTTQQSLDSELDTLYWYPIGVVDPTVRGYQPIVDAYTSVAPPWVAYRNCYATQLNFNAFCVATQPASAEIVPQFTLPFDVAQYAELRLRVGLADIDPLDAAADPKYTYVVPTNANVQIYYLLSR